MVLLMNVKHFAKIKIKFLKFDLKNEFFEKKFAINNQKGCSDLSFKCSLI